MMKHKNQLMLKIIPLFIGVSVATSSYALTDPFLKQWRYNDGIKTYILNITESSAPGQNYHIDYTFPGGSSETDMCVIQTEVSFTCISGETATRDDATHQVKLHSRFGNYVFYDPDFMPDDNPILGNWYYKMPKHDNYVGTISIMRGPSDTDFNVLTSFHDDRGSQCFYDIPDVYHATSNPDGTQTLSHDRHPLPSYSFKYDPQKKQIVSPHTSQFFEPGSCIAFLDDDSVIFTK